MLQWLLSLPKKILVALVLIVSILFIMLSDPPHTICRTQIENFKSRQKGRIYRDSTIKTRKQPLMQILITKCKTGNSPGNCYELFLKTKNFLQDFKTVSFSCRSGLASLNEVKSTLFDIYSLMIRLAWGDGSSIDYYNNIGWLLPADISLFCNLKENIMIFYGQQALLHLEQSTFKKLPNTKKKSEKKIRELSLVSKNCEVYL